MGVSALAVTAQDRAAFGGRPRAIDPQAADGLHCLGHYVRPLPVNLRRMMENAHDWEHLPFVHPSSFAAIAEVESGAWGWRCKTQLPGGGGEQLIELLVDEARHYWATSVVEGAGQGTQIHTQAVAEEAGGITVDVRFYVPQPPATPEQGAMILAYLQAQYATLYDEDEALMLGRQEALDERRSPRPESAPECADLGPEASLDRGAVHEAALGRGTVLVRHTAAGWAAHAARCPHALAPLKHAAVDEGNGITCPWHGYRFDLATGMEVQGRCGALPLFAVAVEDGHLVVRAAAG